VSCKLPFVLEVAPVALEALEGDRAPVQPTMGMAAGSRVKPRQA